MKRALFVFGIVALALASYAGDYADWYTPAKSFSQQSRTPHITYFDSELDPKIIDVKGLTLDSNLTACLGAVESAILGAKLSESAKNAFYLAKAALAKAIYAELQAEKTDQEVKSLGASIETIFNLTTADRVDSNGAVISSGKFQEGMRGKLKSAKDALINGGGSGDSGTGSESDPLKIVVTDYSYDTHEFEQIQMNGNKSKMGLKGYKNLAPITTWTGDSWLGSTSALGYIPFSSGYSGGDPNDLAWKSWAGFDSAIFKASNKNGKAGQVTFVGWDEGSKCAESMSKMLSKSEMAEDRAKHSVLTRYGLSGSDYALHWVPIGDTVSADFEVDFVSVVTNTALGGVADNKVSIYGFATARQSASGGVRYIPNTDGSDELQWNPVEDFVDENCFDADDGNDGVLTIHGYNDAVVAAADGEAYIPNANPDNDDLQWTKLSDLFNSNVFDVDSEGKVIISGMTDIGDSDIMVISVKGEDTEQEVEGVKFDAGQFEKSDGKLILKGSASASATCSAPLNVMLTSPSDGLNRQRHRILALYTEGNTKEFHWVPLTGVIGLDADEASITTNTANGAVENGVASLYGYATAQTSAAGDGIPRIPNQDGTNDELQWSKLADLLDENEFESNEDDGTTQLLGFADADTDALADVVPYVPCADGAGTLTWAGFDEFFAGSVFKKSSTTGKILLNGTSESSDKFSILAIKTGDDDAQTLGTFGFDRQSIDGEIGASQTVQLHNFNSPTDAVDGKNFSDMLTNASVNISGMGIPVRVANGTGGKPEIRYAGLSKLNIGAIQVDGKTLNTNEEGKIQVIDAEDAEGGKILAMGDEHTASWMTLAGDEDALLIPEGSGSGSNLDVPIEFTDNDNSYYIGLRGWDNENDGVYGIYGSSAGMLSAGYGVTIGDDGSGGGELQVEGFKNGGNCSASLNDMLSKDSESANRSHHQIMARYSTGSGTPSVHWVPINGTIGGAPVDDLSITTNTSHGAAVAENASLYGWASGTAQYAIPYKGSSHLEWLAKPSGATTSEPKSLVYDGTKLDWAKVGGGTALKIVGNQSSTAVVCTNTLTFASASDSNVKVTATSTGNGNVTVTIGVYYK